MATKPTYTTEQLKALQTFAKRIMNYEHRYTKAQLMVKINKLVEGDTERAKKAFYSLVSSKVIVNEASGKVVMLIEHQPI